MSEEPEKPKIISLHTREAYKSPGERVAPAVNGVDEMSLNTATAITQLIRNGEAHGLIAAMMAPDTGYPIVFTQFPPGTLPRRAALEMIGLLDCIRECLQDVVEHGLEALAPEMAVEDDEGDE